VKKILIYLIIFCLSFITSAQGYLICDEYEFGEQKSRDSYLLDYKSLENKNIIIVFEISNFSISFLEKIKNNRSWFEEFVDLIKKDTFDFQTSAIAKHWYEEIDVHFIKIIKKTPIQWFGVTEVRENFSNSSYKNASEFKINLMNGKAILDIGNEHDLSCKIIELNLFGEKIEGFREHYFKDQE